MRGLLWALKYFPDGYFPDGGIEPEDRKFETPRLAAVRTRRILWLGRRIASLPCGRLLYDRAAGRFSAPGGVRDSKMANS